MMWRPGSGSSLRCGRSAQTNAGAMLRFVVEPGGFRPGVEPGKLDQLLDAAKSHSVGQESLPRDRAAAQLVTT